MSNEKANEEVGFLRAFIVLLLLICLIIAYGCMLYSLFNPQPTTTTVMTKQEFIQKNQICMVDGQKINCSEFYDKYPHYAKRHGWNEVSGLCRDDNATKCVKKQLENMKEGGLK